MGNSIGAAFTCRVRVRYYIRGSAFNPDARISQGSRPGVYREEI